MKKLFEALLRSDEVRKVDFKRDQYGLDNERCKSKLVKDILCMANASGDDGYIVLGVKSEKGRPKEVIGIAGHHDSADLAGIVNSVVQEPIQFEYHTIKYKGMECAVIHIPNSIGGPHWSKRDFGVLKKHVFYTRRASGNTEASIAEIRQLCIQTIRLSDAVRQKAKVSSHVIDELATLNMDERECRMYKMLRSVSPKIGLRNYRSLVYRGSWGTETRGALIGSYSGDKGKHELVIVMYPWTVTWQEIVSSRRRVSGILRSGSKIKLRSEEKERLKVSTLVHIAYKNIYTRALENRYYDSKVFTNEIKEAWGKVMIWKEHPEEERHEFFMTNVSSKEELKERLMQLIDWANRNIEE